MLTLDERPDGNSILYSCKQPQGVALRANGIELDDEVDLAVGVVRILAKVIDVRQDGTIVGRIYGFESNDEPSFEGLEHESVIRFNERNVFTCRYACA